MNYYVHSGNNFSNKSNKQGVKQEDGWSPGPFEIIVSYCFQQNDSGKQLKVGEKREKKVKFS